MKLKEQIDQTTWIFPSWEVVEELEKIADDFAIDFFNWASSYKANDINNWSLSTKELLKIYKEL